VDYDELYEVTLPPQFHAIKQDIYAAGRNQKHRAVVTATVLRNGIPAQGLVVSFSRTISGRVPNFQWRGTTSANGQVRLELTEANLFQKPDISGTYTARAVDGTGAILGLWGSIPIKGGKEIALTLVVGGSAWIESETMLGPEPVVAAKPAQADSSEEDVQAEAPAFGLGPNYPNPFNPATQIAFQIPEPGEVSLVVYNLNGQVIRELVRGPQEAGLHRVTWDGRDAAGRGVSSGIYFCRLESRGLVQTRQMLLLK
jgi:hypothetical protein